MNKIIKNIKQKSKSNTNCIINLLEENNEIEIEISMDLVLKFQLTKNAFITNEDFEKIIIEQNLIDAKQIAFNFASYSPKTKKQIIDKLKSKEFNTVTINQAIIFLEKFNLIDDEKFAKVFINDYFLKKKAGKLKIKNDLIKKGIDKNLVEKAILKYFPEEKTIEFAMNIAEKKLKIIKNKPKDKQKQMLYNHLINKGFSFDEAKKITNEIFK